MKAQIVFSPVQSKNGPHAPGKPPSGQECARRHKKKIKCGSTRTKHTCDVNKCHQHCNDQREKKEEEEDDKKQAFGALKEKRRRPRKKQSKNKRRKTAQNEDHGETPSSTNNNINVDPPATNTITATNNTNQVATSNSDQHVAAGKGESEATITTNNNTNQVATSNSNDHVAAGKGEGEAAKVAASNLNNIKRATARKGEGEAASKPAPKPTPNVENATCPTNVEKVTKATGDEVESQTQHLGNATVNNVPAPTNKPTHNVEKVTGPAMEKKNKAKPKNDVDEKEEGPVVFDEGDDNSNESYEEEDSSEEDSSDSSEQSVFKCVVEEQTKKDKELGRLFSEASSAGQQFIDARVGHHMKDCKLPRGDERHAKHVSYCRTATRLVEKGTYTKYVEEKPDSWFSRY